jgi:hypothetical protein
MYTHSDKRKEEIDGGGEMHLDCLVVTRGVKVCDLHKESRDERLANVDIVILGAKLGASQRQIVFGHQSRELLPNIISRLQRP